MKQCFTCKIENENIKIIADSIQEASIIFKDIAKNKSFIITKNEDIKIIKISINDIITVFKQLYFLTNSGINISDSLEVMVKEEKNQNIKSLLLHAKISILHGVPLSNSLNDFNLPFNKSYLAILEAGESCSSVPFALKKIIEILERNLKIKNQIQKTLAYPAFLMFACLSLFSFAMLNLIPSIKESISIDTLNLSVLTRYIFICSDIFCSHTKLLTLLLISFFILIFKKKDLAINLLFNVKYIRDISEAFNLSACFAMMSILLKNKISLVNAIKKTLPIASSKKSKKFLENAIDRVIIGLPMIVKEDNIDSFMIAIFSSGSQSGNLDSAFEYIAKTLEEKATENTEKLLGLLGPIIILIMGFIIGVIIIAILTPITNMDF